MMVIFLQQLGILILGVSVDSAPYFRNFPESGIFPTEARP